MNTPTLIIGGGLGGLSAAIHLRLRGHDVCVLEKNPQVGGRASRISRDGFLFDTGPTLLNYPWVFEDLFKAAGRRLGDYVELIPVEPSVAFQWPDGQHLQLSSDYQCLLENLQRLEPGVGPGLAAFLEDAGEKYRISFEKLVTRNADSALDWLKPLSLREMARLSVWRSLDGELKRFFKSQRIREALGAYGMYLGGSPFNLPGIFSILPWGELVHGLWLPRGGIYALVRAIEKLAVELGVRIRTGAQVSRIHSDAGQVAGVELAGGEFLPARIVVSNVDVPTSESELVDDARARAAGRKRAAATRMTPGVLTFYWGVRGVPANLGHHTIFLPDDYRGAFDDLMNRGRVPAGLPFYVAMPSATDPSLAPAGDSTLFVLVPTPTLKHLQNTDWSAETARIRQQVLDRLAAHGVRIAPGDIVTEEVWTPVAWRERCGLFQGSAFGAAHNLMQVGPFRAANRSRELRGLYFAGAGTTPGTGMPMVVLSGRLVAERIDADVLTPVG